MGALTLDGLVVRERAPSAGAVRSLPEQANSSPGVRRRTRWPLGLLIAGTAALVPVWAEAQADQRLRETFGPGFELRLDVSGLELRAINHESRDGRVTVTMEHVRVRPTIDGVLIEIDGLQGHVRSRPVIRRPVAPRFEVPDADASTRRSELDGLGERLEQLVDDLHGVPLRVDAVGTVVIDLGGGDAVGTATISVVAEDPTLKVEPNGRTLADLRLTAGTADRAWVQGELALASTPDSGRDFGILATLVLDPDGVARELGISGRASPTRLHLELDDDAGGRGTIDVRRRSASDPSDRFEVLAERLPLALLDPLAELIEHREPRPGDRPAVGEARLSGLVEGERTRDGSNENIRLRFDHTELAELVVEHDWLASRPVQFDTLSLDGELTIEDTPHGRRSAGQLVLGHAGVQLLVGGQLDAERLDLGLELPATACNDLLTGLPRGFAPALAGSELSGTVSGRLGLDLPFDRLGLARSTYLGPGIDPHRFDISVENGTFVPPGELEFEFPFLEQCRVDRLGPAVDVAGLAGPYHHDFVAASGAHERRVLAPGDSHFVAIEEVPQLELAFVILEDWRFWDHDGFDRKQIAKAFWFDLMAGKTSRGASTISQQTARSLWLGRVDHGPGRKPAFDRSIARKLVEGVLTGELERHIDKRRILEVYLNVIELGPDIRGVADAAEYHFGKRAQDLDLLEALHLASLAPAPVGYSRRFSSGTIDAKWREHLRLQIRRLRVRGLISADVADRYLNPRLVLRPHPELAP